MSSSSLGAEKSTKSQIPQLNHTLGCYKHIGWLDVSVHDTSGVHVVQGTTDLYEVFPDGLLWDKSVLPLEMLYHS